ncbi:MAG TPA: helix-turn-helix domain-containing protein [Blastocatellia bacterium]|nr:helix-turn-helix domain-containing protein [Blastocatellia bacterium]
MDKIDNSRKGRNSFFSQMLSEKREAAGLSLSDLAEMTRLPLSLLERLEADAQASPSFDECYKIAQALNARRPSGFMIQDLWRAATLSRQNIHPIKSAA